MSINILSVNIKKVKKYDRLEPRYYYNSFNFLENDKNLKIIKLGDKQILKYISDGEHSGQVFVKKGIRFIKNSSIKDFDINILDGFFIDFDKHKKLQKSALKPLDVLFTTIGHIGSASIVPPNFGEANINQNVVKMEINSEVIDPYYLVAYLNSNITKKQINSLATGNIHSMLSHSKIKNINIIIPDKNYQNYISTKYKNVVELSQKANLLINKAKNIFYQNLNVNFNNIEKERFYSIQFSNIKKYNILTYNFFNPFYEKIINKIKENKNTVILNKIANINKGNEIGSNNYITYLDKNHNDIPFIRTSDFFNYEVDIFPDYYISKSIYDNVNQDLMPGDILFTKDGKIGETALITKNDNVMISSGIAKLRLNEFGYSIGLSNEYLFLVLSIKEIGLYSAIKYTTIATTIPHLKPEDIGLFEIPILENQYIKEITNIIKESFSYKNEKKKLLKVIRDNIDNKFNFI